MARLGLPVFYPVGPALSLQLDDFLEFHGSLAFRVFLRGLGSLGRSGFLRWFGLGCAVGDPEFGLGIFGTGFQDFPGRQAA